MTNQGRFYAGHLGPIPVFIDWTALFLLYIAWSWREVAAGPGQVGLDAFIICAVVLLGSILAHEASHGLAARLAGATGISITIFALGGMCESRRETRPWHDAGISLAGPLCNLALAAACFGGLRLIDPAQLPPGGAMEILDQTLRAGFLINLVLALLNLMPVYPLDGGQAALGILHGLSGRPRLARRLTFGLSVLTAAGLAAWQLSRPQVDTILLVLLVFLLYSAYQRLMVD